MMSEKIVQLTSADYEEMVDFVNLVFSLNDHPTDFPRLFPLIYNSSDGCMAWNCAIRRNGRIVSMVNCSPKEWIVAGRRLRIGGIGGVATHPRWRGHGFMSTLMRHSVERMKAEGYHASWLGGLRKRYRNFGYEKCGIMYSFAMRAGNFAGWFDAAPIRLQPITAEDQPLIAKAMAMHDRQPMHCRYEHSDFYGRLITWQHLPYAALDESGQMVGYFVAVPRTNAIAELVAKNEQAGLSIVAAWLEHQKTGSATLDLLPHDRARIRTCGRVCENVTLRHSGNWQVFDWPAVIDALLSLKSDEGLMEGSAVVEIADVCKVLIECENGRSSCTVSERSAALRLSAEEAMRFFFGPSLPSCITPLPRGVLALDQWCPLPLGWVRPDSV